MAKIISLSVDFVVINPAKFWSHGLLIKVILKI